MPRTGESLSSSIALLHQQRLRQSTRRSSHPGRTQDGPTDRADIGRSNAVFILLGENVEKLRHTQQWVLWESGVAGAANKDVWVFEAHEDDGKLTVLIPHLHHHVCFEYSDPWLAYIRAVVSSYDDSHVLPAISAGVATSIATENPVAGILAGGIVALLLAGNRQGPPAGLMAILCTQCKSVYRIHRDPAWNLMRCPVCNIQLQLQYPQIWDCDRRSDSSSFAASGRPALLFELTPKTVKHAVELGSVHALRKVTSSIFALLFPESFLCCEALLPPGSLGFVTPRGYGPLETRVQFTITVR